MPHWIVLLAAALGGCFVIVAGGFVIGRSLNALGARLRRIRAPGP